MLNMTNVRLKYRDQILKRGFEFVCGYLLYIFVDVFTREKGLAMTHDGLSDTKPGLFDQKQRRI